jgi:hypothetical protein
LQIFVALQIAQPLLLFCPIFSSTRRDLTYCVPDQDLLRIALLLQSILNLKNSSNPFFYLLPACYTLLSSFIGLVAESHQEKSLHYHALGDRIKFRTVYKEK